MWMLMALLLMTFSACNDDDNHAEATHFVDYKVAVIMPFSQAELHTRFRQTAQWALSTLEKAQRGAAQGIRLQLEWFDESAYDMNVLGKELANRADIVAVVGPYTSTNAQQMAYQCAMTGKMMITPAASSEEFVRAFSRQNFLWSLVETDISQCEVLLSKAITYGAKSVSLLTSDDIYGNTFNDWFAFQAAELGLQVVDIQVYGADNLQVTAQQMVRSEADYLVCVASDTDAVRTILEAKKARGDVGPRLLFTDGAMTPDLLSLGTLANGVEGVSMYADPTSGFELAYEVHFNETPMGAEARLYDALLLIAFALADQNATGETNLNESMKRVVSGTGTEVLAWDEVGIYRTLSAIGAGHYFNITGAGGSLKFDAEVHTNVLQTVYCHWYAYEGKIIVLDFCSSDGGNRTDATLANWNWQVQQQQIFDDGATGIEYADLHRQQALLIAGSSGWGNYRHQADVLYMYQLLKQNGYSDDDIVLIVADDIAHHASNPFPGVVRVSPTGTNLYQDVVVDYDINQLHPDDIRAILAGESSDHLPHVIDADQHTNVLVFWSGHGARGEFNWLKAKTGFTHDLMAQTLTQLSAQQKYRKMLWLIETCYSSSVAKASVGVPGVLCFAAADELEVSFADIYSQELGAWMTNRFTRNMTEAVTDNPAICYRDLYYHMQRNTLGSHVKVHNAPMFDNLYLGTIDEFMTSVN